MGNGSGVSALLLGLEGFRVLHALEEDGELFVLVETTREVVGCPECGTRAKVKDRPRTTVRDVTIAGRPAQLVWRKRRWTCPDPHCPKRSWRETHPAMRPRALLTERARRDIFVRVGRDGHTVAELAGAYGVAWGTAMRAVRELGQEVVEDPERIGQVEALGVDETSWLKATPSSPTRWATGLVDLDRGLLLDVVEDRTSAALSQWLAARGQGWREQVRVAALDPFAGYKTALRHRDVGLPHARLVVDHWHAVRLANQAVDQVRRRVQRELTGHRGHKDDALYGIRRVLLVANERLSDRARQRLEAGLAAGDPDCEVGCAWMAKELLRAVYAAEHLDDARVRLVEFYSWAAEVDIPEVSRLASTISAWHDEVLAYWTTGRTSNARTEAMNLNIKTVKRTARGFRNFSNYRLRLLLRCGVQWHTPPTAQVRRHQPPIAA